MCANISAKQLKEDMAAKDIGVAFSQIQLLAFQQKGARCDLVKSLSKLKSIYLIIMISLKASLNSRSYK